MENAILVGFQSLDELRELATSAGARVVEEIVQQYSHLKPADVHDALAYAYDHLEEIEAGLAADDEARVKALYRSPSL